MNRDQKYDIGLQLIHWLTAAIIIALIAVGAVLEDLPKGELKGTVIGIHKGFGVVVLLLLAARVGWRLTHSVPDLPASMPPREVLLAKLGHLGLYALMAMVPMAGILLSQAGGHPVSLFGMTLPTFVGKDEGLHEFFEEAHGFLAWSMAALIGGHVLAAVRHQYLLRDGVLERMLPWSR